MKNLIKLLILLLTISSFSQEVKIDSISIYLTNTTKLLKTVSESTKFVKTLDSLSVVYKTDSFTLVSFVKDEIPVVGIVSSKPPKKEN